MVNFLPVPADGAVEKLSAAQCWGHLEGTRMGRLALLDASGEPELFPVNFLTSEGLLYIRTANDSKLRHIRARPTVAFEADGNEHDLHWSVLVRGDAVQVVIDEEIRRSGVAQLSTASPAAKPFYIRITPSSITGRRFREGIDVRTRFPLPTGPVDRPAVVPRSTRPNPIPHLPPFEE